MPDFNDEDQKQTWEGFVFAIQLLAVYYILYTIWN